MKFHLGFLLGLASTLAFAQQGGIGAIKVEPIAERIGHYLGNVLIFLLNGTGAVTQARRGGGVLCIQHQKRHRIAWHLGAGQLGVY